MSPAGIAWSHRRMNPCAEPGGSSRVLSEMANELLALPVTQHWAGSWQQTANTLASTGTYPGSSP